MNAEPEEANPFESPLVPVSGAAPVEPKSWRPLWAATGLLALLAVLSVFSDSMLIFSFLIPLVGVPALLRTIIDLNRKLAAGWTVDAAVQLKSFGLSLLITGVTLFSAGIAGLTVCYAGMVAAISVPGLDSDGLALAVFVACVLLVCGIMAGLFYVMGPWKASRLAKKVTPQTGRPKPQDVSEGESSP